MFTEIWFILKIIMYKTTVYIDNVLLNNFFANYYTSHSDIYSFSKRFGLFIINYSFSDLLHFHFFPLIIFVIIVEIASQ